MLRNKYKISTYKIVRIFKLNIWKNATKEIQKTFHDVLIGNVKANKVEYVKRYTFNLIFVKINIMRLNQNF